MRIPIPERTAHPRRKNFQSSPEREDPPERSDPPERAQQDAADINRGDPFQNMTEEELAAWRTAEDQFLGPG